MVSRDFIGPNSLHAIYSYIHFDYIQLWLLGRAMHNIELLKELTLRRDTLQYVLICRGEFFLQTCDFAARLRVLILIHARASASNARADGCMTSHYALRYSKLYNNYIKSFHFIYNCILLL